VERESKAIDGIGGGGGRVKGRGQNWRWWRVSASLHFAEVQRKSASQCFQMHSGKDILFLD